MSFSMPSLAEAPSGAGLAEDWEPEITILAANGDNQ
jgi:hypothetical protein